MLFAASNGIALLGVALSVVFYLLPFYFARRIGKPKGRAWFFYVFFLGWIGVLVLAVREPKWSAGSLGSSYHVPPGVRGQQRR